ncbi:MAG: hypothetical protein WBQ50_14200 [Nocardioides sp.]
MTREDTATSLLDDLSEALESGIRSDVVALAAPGDREAVRELVALRANARSLRLADLSMRYVDDNAGRSVAGIAPSLAERAWVGDIRLDWSIGGFDRGVSSMEVTMTFVQTDDGAAFVTARTDYGRPAPLWLLERLGVERSDRSLVLAAERGDAAMLSGYADLADQAVRDVRKVLPRWRGSLVVEVPDSERQLVRALDSADGAYSAIAAVTTPADGSPGDDRPIHIFVNPPVFGPLGEQGAQIVMSHEAAHVATGAAASSMPTWLLEGFADYVALAHVDLPVAVTASQILEQVRSSGVPGSLPGPPAFETDSPDLGASYESAWLACRLLAEEYGEDRLIAFYERADVDGSTTGAFEELGTTESAFTRTWRDYLGTLADA